MSIKNRYVTRIVLFALLCLPFLLPIAARAQAKTRTVNVKLKAPHGTYRMELFKVGNARPTLTINDIKPAGGKLVSFSNVPTKTEYFFRVTNIESDDKRQPPSFFLPDKPSGTQTEKDIVW